MLSRKTRQCEAEDISGISFPGYVHRREIPRIILTLVAQFLYILNDTRPL